MDASFPRWRVQFMDSRDHMSFFAVWDGVFCNSDVELRRAYKILTILPGAKLELDAVHINW